MSKKVIKNALLGTSTVDIAVQDGVISEIAPCIDGDVLLDAEGKVVIPGLVDTHLHAFGGYDVLDGELEKISLRLAKEGTTCWLPTTMTVAVEELQKVTDMPLPTEGATVAGFHLEGPYISAKRKGAQNEAFIKKADIEEFKRFKNVKRITVAPEEDGAVEFIKAVDCQVSLGHTDCTYEEALKAIEAGADCLTHTFNAMPPMLHRAPGPIGAAVEKGIYAELICDGNHVSKAAVLALYKMLGADRVMLISDTIRPAGCPDGKYSSGGLDVFMKDGVATLSDGTLAGGSQPLLFGVKKAVEFGIPFDDAVKMASETPAKALGLNKGKIAVGFDADLVILDGDLNVCDTVIGGKVIQYN